MQTNIMKLKRVLKIIKYSGLDWTIEWKGEILKNYFSLSFYFPNCEVIRSNQIVITKELD